MLSNDNNNNLLFGQLQDNEYFLGETIGLQLKEKMILIRDNLGAEAIRFYLDSNILKYQVTLGGILQPPQSLTDPGVITENDSVTLPHNPSNTRIDLSNNKFKLFLQNVLRYQHDGDSVFIKFNNLTCDNGISNVGLKMSFGNQQTLQIINNDTSQVIFELSSVNIDLKTKSVTGIQPSSDMTSAVNLMQLTNVRPKFLQTAGVSNNIQIQNQLEQDLVVINNSGVTSNLPLQYNIRPLSFLPQTIPDILAVNNLLSGYQQLTLKDVANGYLGLDALTKIPSQFQTPTSTQLLNSVLQTFAQEIVTTDHVQEGIQKLYLTSQRVNDLIQVQKGSSNGLCPLNSSSKIPSQYLDTIQTGNIYSGQDTQKTNPANPTYNGQSPIKGDQYISTDSSKIYILSNLPFTTPSNWVELVLAGVNSVNGQSGSVILNTDNIIEGSSNKYFESGIFNYLSNTANQINQLLKLNSSGYIDSQQLNNRLLLKNGVIQVHDDNISSLVFRNNFNLDPIYSINTGQMIAYKPFKYSSLIPIVNNTDIVHKSYVDSAIIQYFPTKLLNSLSQIQITPTQGIITIDGQQISQISQTEFKTEVPMTLDLQIPIINSNQLVTKQYVDSILQDFINGSGVTKEFLSLKSTQPITGSQKVINWISQLQSLTQERVYLNNNNINVVAGQYRIYINVVIEEFTEVDMVDVVIQLRNNQTQQVYQSFPNKISPQGGQQTISLSYPFTYQFNSSVQLAVYMVVQNSSYGVYNTEFFVEELQKLETNIGQDRITNSSLVSKLQITDQDLNIQVNSVDYGSFTQNKLNLNTGIKIIQNQNTVVDDPNQLVSKSYVDREVTLATASISDIGQLLHVQLTADQTIGLQAGGNIAFNSAQTNTSLTTQVDSLGMFTFQPGFVYRVFYTVSGRFLSNVGFAQIVCRNAITLQPVVGSYVYLLMTSNSNDTQVASSMFYIDLRASLVSVTYKFAILSQQNLQQLYKQFSGCCVEQVQQIQEQLFDRIQNADLTSQIKLYNQQIETKLDNQLLHKVANESGSVVFKQQIVNTNFKIRSTADSTSIAQNLQLDNSSAILQRQCEFVSSISNSFSSVLRSKITDSGSGNKKIVEIGGVGGDQLNMFTTDYLDPQLQIFTDEFTNLLPIVANKKIGYSNGVTISENKQLITKEYADNLNIFPVGGILMWYASVIPTNFLICNGSAFSSSTYPKLFTALGTAVLPDFRGYFIRGLEASATPIIETTVNRTLGSIQLDQNKAHTHTVQDQYHNIRTDEVRSSFDSNRTFATNSFLQRTVTSSSNGGTEARPKNIAVHFIIRAL